MEMIKGPLYAHDVFGEGTSLVIALIIGIVFGFLLERAGFGSSRKLTSVFYLDDFAVPKVMFSAVVTAAAGIYIFSISGLLNMEEIVKLPTYVWPQIIGGILFGLGFLIGGYCPGTAFVAIGSGKIDGILYIVGAVTAGWFFTYSFDFVKGFYLSGKLEHTFLYEGLGIPRLVLLLIVVSIALGFFAVLERYEKRKIRSLQ
ncbi:MAG: DUF6691 family protein [Thermodesulfovibrionales bacterium]